MNTYKHRADYDEERNEGLVYENGYLICSYNFSKDEWEFFIDIPEEDLDGLFNDMLNEKLAYDNAVDDFTQFSNSDFR